jgi:hypothetical protein
LNTEPTYLDKLVRVDTEDEKTEYERAQNDHLRRHGIPVIDLYLGDDVYRPED